MKERIHWIVKTVCSACLLFLVLTGWTAGAPAEDDVSFDNYGVYFVGEATGARPDNIVRLENNGEILLACIQGKTSEELRKQGLQISNSQIELLVQSRLLELDKGILKTTFPILTPEQTRSLRSLTKEEGYKLGHKIHKELNALKEKLQPMRRAKSLYAILFSYVMDDLVWREFREKGLIEEMKISTGKPTWSGMVWAVHSPRGEPDGTDVISHKGIDFRVYWHDSALPKIKPLIADRYNILNLIDGYIKKGKIKNEKARKELVLFNLIDSSGEITLPVITEKRGDPLYERCLAISKAVVDYFTGVLNLGDIEEDLALEDEEQALLIVFRELMWDMTKYLEAQGLVQKPEVFAFPERAQQTDIGDLTFLITKERIKSRK